jgi:hypothetical protein
MDSKLEQPSLFSLTKLLNVAMVQNLKAVE